MNPFFLRTEGKSFTPVGVYGEEMSNFWYENRHKLQPGMIFLTDTNDVVQLDRGVAGDATKWFVLDLDQSGWSHWDSTVEASELAYHVS